MARSCRTPACADAAPESPLRPNATMLIRHATPDDAAAIQAIYAPIVDATCISFETTAPTVAEMRARIVATTLTHPWLVSEDAGGSVDGYAYAGRHRNARPTSGRWML